MNLLVVMKQTFDTEEKIIIEQGQIKDDGAEFIINPYDEYAVEEAIKLRDEWGGEVTVITVGPARAESALRTALAMGADRAVIVSDEHIVDGDGHTISKVLAAVIKDRAFDLILAGNMSIDHGAAQVGPRLAEELGIAHVAAVTEINIKDSVATVIRDVEGDSEAIEVPLPLLVTAQQGLNEPRYPSLPGIMKAKRKPMERLTIDDLGLNADQIAAKTVIVDQFNAPKKEAGRMLAGAPREQVKELAQLLRHEAKVV
ncbi:electron transfer flavoprotein subunit beta [Ammoniphilus oxalaticus]|uniref:Electron transfer flavoprotein subunit beta n=1 Tax=Ammoniphilus oxalaticus TaxID=66863 RepID=A0A419SIQ5_9BACL|nr:electron transfer flavoprotein subunit beta/FixA family protein [Ammoniphilus oxalaticus]RKD23836.1 electron transfer flavoprotein subunit beta [Ammoniphilus oxalaticus]